MEVYSIIYNDFTHWNFTNDLRWPRMVPIWGNARVNWIYIALLYIALAPIKLGFHQVVPAVAQGSTTRQLRWLCHSAKPAGDKWGSYL